MPRAAPTPSSAQPTSTRNTRRCHGNQSKSGPYCVAMISVHTSPLARLGEKDAGGLNVYVRELSRQLGRLGVAVDVFTRRTDPNLPDVEAADENVRSARRW